MTHDTTHPHATEPLPFDKAQIVVTDEHFPLVQNLIREAA